MHYFDIQKVMVLSYKICKASNEVVCFMRKNYDQLTRTNKYHKLLNFYGNTKDKAKRKIFVRQLNGM